MVDIKCRFGERIRIGEHGFLQVIAIMPDYVVLRLTTDDRGPSRPPESALTEEELEFRHSE